MTVSLAPAPAPTPAPVVTTPAQRPPASEPDEADEESFALLADVPPVSSRRLRPLHTIPSALGALRANKGRSILTTLGIIIGVAAVIAIVSLGEGASASVAGQLQGLGTNVLTVTPGSTSSGGVRAGAGTSTTLKASDADAITSLQGVASVSAVVSGSAQVVARSQNWQTHIEAVSPSYEQIEDWQVASGAFFTDEDNESANSVAVIGQTVATNLFPNGQSPVGQLIRIRNMPFTIVGVLVSKGTGVGGDQDDVVMIPFRTGQIRLFGSQSINQIVLQVSGSNQADVVTQEVTNQLRQLHQLPSYQANDFTVQSNADVISRVAGVSQTMTLLLAGVAAVSLVVGGIGIMNIMLVSVTERTREIGIRLGIGARPSDVLAQFLVEAVVLSLLGGIVGILIGVAVALLLPVVAGWATVLPWDAIALSFGFSALIGVFFGIYPARKASRLDPIVALRFE